MAVVSNLNTRQTPMTGTGGSGTQSVKFINAPRVYIKAVDSSPAPCIAKSNGTTPSGWTDLGIVNGPAKITYQKDMKEVRTGIEQVLRAEYITKKTGNFEADMAQFDDVLIGNLTGLTASTVATSTVQFGVGQEAVVTKAILLVAQNVIDGKEIQWYNPSAIINLAYNNNGDETSVKITGEFLFFTYGGSDILFTQTHFA